jgi:hypothetical protein
MLQIAFHLMTVMKNIWLGISGLVSASSLHINILFILLNHEHLFQLLHLSLSLSLSLDF